MIVRGTERVNNLIASLTIAAFMVVPVKISKWSPTGFHVAAHFPQGICFSGFRFRMRLRNYPQVGSSWVGGALFCRDCFQFKFE